MGGGLVTSGFQADLFKALLVLSIITSLQTVVDANLPPQWMDFEPSIFVSENEEVGTVIANISGKDVDGDGLLFDVSGPDGVVYVLRVSIDSATVVLGTKLDREVVSMYNFKFTISDGINDPISRYSALYVLDTNDNAPHFEKDFYRASVSEDTAEGREVLRVSAQDPDLGHEGLVTYTQDPEESWADFTVDWVSGIIRVAGDLDMGRRSKYHLAVRATDGGGLSGRTDVEIHVTTSSENSSKNALHCYHCNGTFDCTMDQLSYSTTSRCKPNQLCFIEEVQGPESVYDYSRGCRDVDVCGERDTEQCTTKNDLKTCVKCCSDRICNRDRLTQQRRQYVLEQAKDLGGNTENLFHETMDEEQTGEGLNCHHCDKSVDCALEQLSYSTTTRCPRGSMCFVDAVQKSGAVVGYEYTRGCKETEFCREIDKEFCDKESGANKCTMCCSEDKCNGPRMEQHRLQEARELLAQVAASSRATTTKTSEITTYLFLLFQMGFFCKIKWV